MTFLLNQTELFKVLDPILLLFLVFLSSLQLCPNCQLAPLVALSELLELHGSGQEDPQ